MLDFETQFLAGMAGPVKRGEDFAAGSDQDIRTFIEGRAVFLEQGTQVFRDIAEIDAGAQLEFLPEKMPFRTMSGPLPAGSYNRSIPVFVSSYYAVSSLAAVTDKKLAYDFLVWLNSSGRKYLAENPAFIPHDPESDPEASNSLAASLLRYIGTDDIIAGSLIENSTTFMDKYMAMPVWTEADYSAIAEYVINAQ
jgi:raffinose/stachyose/melibiose transport system substrate-binding protein